MIYTLNDRSKVPVIKHIHPLIPVKLRKERALRRYFSLEMTSRENLEKINIQQGKDGVLLEGNLGKVKEITLIEDRLLELNCTNGVIRLNIHRDDLLKALTKKENNKGESE